MTICNLINNNVIFMQDSNVSIWESIWEMFVNLDIYKYIYKFHVIYFIAFFIKNHQRKSPEIIEIFRGIISRLSCILM